MQNMKDVVPVAFATDSAYCVYTCVTLNSILQNRRADYFIRFLLLVPHDFSDEARQLALTTVNLYQNCSVEFIDMAGAFDDAHIEIAHINIVTYYRLLLPALLPDCEKCLYLDSDVVVCGDLRELLVHDIEEYYLAGVNAPWFVLYADKEYYKNIAGLPSMDSYVNAGVLLLNLKKLRQDGIDQQLMELSNKKFPVQDQDIINIACYGGILLLPLRYNAMTNVYLEIEKYKEVFAPDEIEDAWNHPVIVHYATKNKPWLDRSLAMADRWWCSLVRTEAERALLFKLIDISTADSERKWKNKWKSEQNKLTQLKRSTSHRIGRFITWLPRKVWGAAKCFKTHGLFGMLRHIARKAD